VAQRENICHETRKDLSSHHRSNSSTGNFMRRLYRSGGRLEKVLTSSRMNVGHTYKSRWWASPLALAAALMQ